MNRLGRICGLVSTLLLTLTMFLAATGTSLAFGQAELHQTITERDGQHDFDFWFGHWKVHNRRLLHPLTGSKDWVEFDGTVVARPIWAGRANVDEFEADTPSGHIEGMTVRTYDSKSHEWNIYWVNAAKGSFEKTMIGEFKN